jgi:ferritin-like metal-binding protein YciE
MVFNFYFEQVNEKLNFPGMLFKPSIKKHMANSKQQQGMKNAHLHDLFIDELRDILGAEKQLLKGLKKMASAASGESLKAAFEEHYAQTEEQINRLKGVFQSLGLLARSKKCKAMVGLLEEADEIIEDFEDDPALDAALIAAAQKVEHYEIASYGCLVTYAELMEHTEAMSLLEETLNEEKETDSKLTQIALSESNLATKK